MRLAPLSIPFLFALTTGCQAVDVPLRFDFGSGSVAPGFTAVRADTLYTPRTGYGLLESGSTIHSVSGPAGDALHADALRSDQPFFFLIDLPEGNYDINLLLGAPDGPADNTVKAETRRLMLQSVKTENGKFVSRSCTVNVRTTALPDGRTVSLKAPAETAPGIFHWDDKLILEFNGTHPAVAALEIKRNDTALTVHIAGDSTVTDQGGEPWSSWGQMLPRFFAPGTAVANHSWSGLTLGSFRNQNRLDKLLSMLKPGDYVFVQFAHNDMKEQGENAGAFKSYADNLRHYADAITSKGGKPVFVTSMYRRRFKGGTLQDTLGDYPVAMRQVAQEKNVPLIDLHAMSGRVFTALGESQSKDAFVHFPAGAHGSDKAVADNTHFSSYGGYELARCVVQGIRDKLPELATRLAPDAGVYDSDHPGSLADFDVPASPPRGRVDIPEGDGRK